MLYFPLKFNVADENYDPDADYSTGLQKETNSH